MTIKTPRHRATLWLVANISLIAVVPAAASYFSRRLSAGLYPTDADSIGIPVAGIAIWTLILLVPLNISCWLLLRQYPGSVPFAASSKGSSYVSRVISVCGVLFGVLCAVAAVVSLVSGGPEFTPVFLLWCWTIFAIRAAYVASARDHAKSVTE